MAKIAHITDVHVKYDNPEPNAAKFREIINDALSYGCTHVMLTGDIADYADERDFAIIREVLSGYDLLNSSKLSVIPGNHDIYGGPSPEVPFFLYPSLCRELDYGGKLNLFYNSFIETFENTLTGSSSYLPYVKIINGDTALIGINSVAEYSEERNPLGTNGFVSGQDVKLLEELTGNEALKDKVKLVMIHHHFNRPEQNKEHPEHVLWLKTEQWKMRLYGKGTLLDYFKKYEIDAVFHGHTHITDTYERKGNLFVNSSGGSFPFTISGEREYHIIETGEDARSTAQAERESKKKRFNLIKRKL